MKKRNFKKSNIIGEKQIQTLCRRCQFSYKYDQLHNAKFSIHVKYNILQPRLLKLKNFTNFYWIIFYFRCKVVQFLIYFTALVSIYTLVLMSLDRYLAVVYPIESITLRTEANCKIAISATWIICAVAGSPLIFANGVDVSEVGSKSFCVFLDNQTLPFIPQEWDLRWRQDAFNVSTVLLLLFFVKMILYFCREINFTKIFVKMIFLKNYFFMANF